jgi:hypothetical protein
MLSFLRNDRPAGLTNASARLRVETRLRLRRGMRPASPTVSPPSPEESPADGVAAARSRLCRHLEQLLLLVDAGRCRALPSAAR